MEQLQLGFPEHDPWQAWLARAHGPRERLEDLILQIKRDTAVLREPKCYHPNDFFERRIEAYRADAQALAEKIQCM